MNRRQFCASLAAAAAGPALAQAPAPPNIIYVLADDLGWGDLGCYNPQSGIATPNANRLASQGVRFTDMHSPSAVCTPTRYGIMTGRYCWRTPLKNGVLWGYSPHLIERGRLAVPAMLKQRGYYTAGVGKWHLGFGTAEKVDYSKPLRPGPVDDGFDYYFGIPASLDMEPYLYFENDRALEQPTTRTPGQDSPRGVFWRPGPIAPGMKLEEVLPTLTRKAVSIIRERARGPRPLFLYFPMTGPHTPWLPVPPFRGRSKAGDYGDFVAQVDDALGQVLRAVEESGSANNTLFVFTSDNGAHWKPEDKAHFAHRANGPWRGQKSDAYEAGHRIPFLARWPGRIQPGTTSTELGCLIDLMGTAAELVDFPLPGNAGEDSYSLLPALLGGGGKPIREALVLHTGGGMFVVRQGPWKLNLGRGSGGFTQPARIQPKAGEPDGELYNLASDPAETKNVYVQNPEVVARLSALLERYQKQGSSRPGA